MKSLSELIKEYEDSGKYFLENKKPVIVRLDGRGFTKFTKKMNFDFPYSYVFNKIMNNVAIHLCKNMECCVFATRHSDEISLFLYDDRRDESQPCFGNSINKILSLSASMATGKMISELLLHFNSDLVMQNIPQIDSRCFNVPIEDVIKYFVSRKIDAERNHISSWARSRSSHNELLNMNSSEKKNLLLHKHGINFDEFSNNVKYGFMFFKDELGWVTKNIPERFEEEFFKNLMKKNGEII